MKKALATASLEPHFGSLLLLYLVTYEVATDQIVRTMRSESYIVSNELVNISTSTKHQHLPTENLISINRTDSTRERIITHETEHLPSCHPSTIYSPTSPSTSPASPQSHGHSSSSTLSTAPTIKTHATPCAEFSPESAMDSSWTKTLYRSGVFQALWQRTKCTFRNRPSEQPLRERR